MLTHSLPSPIQPTWVPPNCHFEVDDAEQLWTFPPNYFDMIHIRNVAQSIADWDKLLGQVYTFVYIYPTPPIVERLW